MGSTSVRLKDEPRLEELRSSLAPVEELMRRGVRRDPDTGRSYFTGYAYKTLYDWDQYFEGIAQIHLGWGSEYLRNAVTIFLDHQRDDGLISRSVPSNEYHDPEHVKPFLAQTALLVIRYCGQSDWITNEGYYAKLERYLAYWRDAMDSAGDGLSEWMSAPHTGMDNQHERAGHWGERVSKGVDLNCYLVREWRALACIAEVAARGGDAARFREEADALAERIRARMWDEADGFFYDLHTGSGDLIRVRSVAGFMPLWAGVATREQARRLVRDYLFNAAEFWTPYPIPALAKSEPGYSPIGFKTDVLGTNSCSWRANAWAPTNYMVYHGLKNYGFDQVASILARATQRLLERAGCREWYDAETGEGRGLDPFWGWSVLGYFMTYEDESGEDPTSLDI